MKVIILLIMISGSSLAYPVVKTWTFHELSHAIEKSDAFIPNMDPEKQPLVDAFDLIMAALFTGKDDYVHALMMSPSGSKTWTIDQLKETLNDSNTNPDLVPFIAQAYQWLNNYNSRGEGKKEITEVWIPALDISTWSPEDVIAALKDPDTKSSLVYYLRTAQKQFEEAAEKGQKKDTMILVTPVGLVPLQDGVQPMFVPRNAVDNSYTSIINSN